VPAAVIVVLLSKSADFAGVRQIISALALAAGKQGGKTLPVVCLLIEPGGKLQSGKRLFGNSLPWVKSVQCAALAFSPILAQRPEDPYERIKRP
jgi:hypothetical protein